MARSRCWALVYPGSKPCGTYQGWGPGGPAPPEAHLGLVPGNGGPALEIRVWPACSRKGMARRPAVTTDSPCSWSTTMNASPGGISWAMSCAVRWSRCIPSSSTPNTSLPRMHKRELRHGGIFRGLLQPSMTSDIVASGKHTHAGLLHSMVQGHAQTSRHDRTISALVRESEGTWIDSSISWS